MFKVPEKYRVTEGRMKSHSIIGNNGLFRVAKSKRVVYWVIASDGEGWEHVSVSLDKAERCPTWGEMCFIKDMFWGEEDVIVQYHPAKKDYVNYHPYTLHLWRPIGIDLMSPPPILVGPL